MKRGQVLSLVALMIAVGTTGGLTTTAQAKTTYRRTKIVKTKAVNYYSTKAASTYQFLGRARQLKLKKNHQLKNYQRTTWIRTKRTMLVKGHKRSLYYYVTNTKNGASGWVWHGNLKPGRNYQMTTAKTIPTKKYVRLKAAKVYRLKGNNRYVQFSDGQALAKRVTYYATQRRTVYRHGQRLTYYYINDRNRLTGNDLFFSGMTKVKGWVLATAIKAGTYHAPEVRPGTIKKGTKINSVAQLPSHLIKPADADKYNSYDKQIKAGGNGWSYYHYVGAFDTSAKIKNNRLTAAQQVEISRYALLIINDFRRQHGLFPMKMSKLSVQMAQNDADMRVKYHVPSGDHSYSGSYPIWQGVTVEQWDNNMMRKTFPDFDTPKDNAHNYFIDDQDGGTMFMGYCPTMLAAKVDILQSINDMAYADGDWDNMHTASLLRTQPYIIGTTDHLDNIWFALNVVRPDKDNLSATVFDMFETWNTKNGATDKINRAFNANLISAHK